MRNSPLLPSIALIAALVMGLDAGIQAGGSDGPPTELQLGEIAVALTLALFGIQGFLSIVVEGQELRPGRVPARLTTSFSVAIVVFSIGLFAIAVALAYGIAAEWSVRAIGILAGVGCIILSVLLVFYKEAFLGDEANFDNRRDGVPW
ncbi:MAG: hypothetical protein M3457_14175 [Chloroflexota bacterium]|nr:hypothetical protein [Chloroflexota bacterium]